MFFQPRKLYVPPLALYIRQYELNAMKSKAQTKSGPQFRVIMGSYRIDIFPNTPLKHGHLLWNDSESMSQVQKAYTRSIHMINANAPT